MQLVAWLLYAALTLLIASGVYWSVSDWIRQRR